MGPFRRRGVAHTEHRLVTPALVEAEEDPGLDGSERSPSDLIGVPRLEDHMVLAEVGVRVRHPRHCPMVRQVDNGFMAS